MSSPLNDITLVRYIDPTIPSSVFRILILRVLSVNRIFPLQVLTAGAISLFLNITGAIAPVAPVLNTPQRHGSQKIIDLSIRNVFLVSSILPKKNRLNY